MNQTIRFFLAIAFLFGGLSLRTSFTADPPNASVIFTNNHDDADLSCQQVLPDVKTPNKPSISQKRSPISDEELFARRDKNKDGQVTWEEFLNGRGGEVVKVLRRRFNNLDANNDNLWQASERKPSKRKPPRQRQLQGNDTGAGTKTQIRRGDPPSTVKPSATIPSLDTQTIRVPSPDATNVVMILADDLGWADTTLYGHTRLYRTPNLQRLANRGMLFTRAYSNSPLCSPTRASLLTGQTPARHGSTAPQHHLPVKRMKASIKPNAPAGNKAVETESVTRLDTTIPTLGKLIRQAGYRNAHFGKWHLGPEPFSPLQHGFQSDMPHHPGPGPAGSYVAPWKF
ncbi:MAG: sulfatase-like hydrolase/transferase, partial [Planctomycetota bacterium]